MKNVGISKMKKIIEKIKAKIRGTIDLERLIKDGLSVGDNFHAQEGVIIDPGHCWLIEIGNNVTLAPRVHILPCIFYQHNHIVAALLISISWLSFLPVPVRQNIIISTNSIPILPL